MRFHMKYVYKIINYTKYIYLTFYIQFHFCLFSKVSDY